jgi:hypothetical protein
MKSPQQIENEKQFTLSVVRAKELQRHERMSALLKGRAESGISGPMAKDFSVVRKAR